MPWTADSRRRQQESKQKNKTAAILSASQVSQRNHAIQARWASERGSEEEVTEYFRNVDIEEGLALLARMRENSKIASQELNQRITADSNKDRCEFCGGPKKVNKQWALVRPYRDPRTLLPRNHFFCSIECVALMNRRDQGVYGVSDRGMLPEMNPQFHPKEVKAEETNHEPGNQTGKTD